MSAKINLRTTTERTTIIAEVNETIADILKKQNVNAAGKVFSINGISLSGTDMNSPISALGVKDGEEAMLAAVTKAESAK